MAPSGLSPGRRAPGARPGPDLEVAKNKEPEEGDVEPIKGNLPAARSPPMRSRLGPGDPAAAKAPVVSPRREARCRRAWIDGLMGGTEEQR